MGNTGNTAPAETGIVYARGKRHSEPRLTAPGTPCDRAATVRQTGGRVLDESATGVLQAGSTHFPPEKHMLDYPEYTLGIQARYGEAGTDGKIRLGALANWFQEAAGHNASALGFGDERLFAEGKAWILTRMAFRIKDLPSPGDKVNIRTWPATLEHLGHRGYEVYNASDELIVAAVSAWTVLDLSTRRLTALPEELAAVYPVNTIPCIPFPSRTIPRLREGIGSSDVLVRRDDLDINGHVNNSKYLGWLLECLPWSPGESLIPSLLDVTFRAECFPGDALTSQCVPLPDETDATAPDGFPQAPHGLLHVIRRTDSGDDVCRAVTRWTQKVRLP